jgi:hypothetical protein
MADAPLCKKTLEWAANVRVPPAPGGYAEVVAGAKAVAAYRDVLRKAALLTGSQWTEEEVARAEAAKA